MKLFNSLQQTVDKFIIQNLSQDRIKVLQPLIQYIQLQKDQNQVVQLNFICTHNSRRSQLSQIWGKTAADYYGVNATTYSGGVEVTACNERIIASLKRMGFEVTSTGIENPVYQINHHQDKQSSIVFSKVYDHAENPSNNFCAVMTCDHADENCPAIVGADLRIPVRYNDPKKFDNTPIEAEKYDERSIQIASELFYVFSKIK